MCRTVRSAHGSISTALNAEAFPHDFADSPTTGSSRMCNTARARANTEPFSPDHRRCSGAGSAPRSATTMTGPGVPGPLGEPRGRAPGGRFRGSDRPIGVPVAAAARLAAPFLGPRPPSLRGPRWCRLSKSATKARIEPKRRKRIVDIPRFFSRPIPVRGAFEGYSAGVRSNFREAIL